MSDAQRAVGRMLPVERRTLSLNRAAVILLGALATAVLALDHASDVNPWLRVPATHRVLAMGVAVLVLLFCCYFLGQHETHEGMRRQLHDARLAHETLRARLGSMARLL